MERKIVNICLITTSDFSSYLESVPETRVENIVPGIARVFVNTWGCAHNSSDSEYMAGQLAAQVVI